MEKGWLQKQLWIIIGVVACVCVFALLRLMGGAVSGSRACRHLSFTKVMGRVAGLWLSCTVVAVCGVPPVVV